MTDKSDELVERAIEAARVAILKVEDGEFITLAEAKMMLAADKSGDEKMQYEAMARVFSRIAVEAALAVLPPLKGE